MSDNVVKLTQPERRPKNKVCVEIDCNRPCTHKIVLIDLDTGDYAGEKFFCTEHAPSYATEIEP